MGFNTKKYMQTDRSGAHLFGVEYAKNISENILPQSLQKKGLYLSLQSLNLGFRVSNCKTV